MLQADLRSACRSVAGHYYGDKGVWAYDCFEALNATFFGGTLPWPCILWGLTAHGGCLGQTCSRNARAPVIVLHPSTLKGTGRRPPWGLPRLWLGQAYALDVLLHELMHVSVDYCLGGGSGPTSHNNTAWVAEVNRLAPLLGLHGIEAGMNKVRRVVDPDAALTKTGKPGTRVARGSDGNLPHEVVARFPHAVRMHLDTADAYYQAAGKLPPWSMKLPVTD
jgi:hypothetical protein